MLYKRTSTRDKTGPKQKKFKHNLQWTLLMFVISCSGEVVERNITLGVFLNLQMLL